MMSRCLLILMTFGMAAFAVGAEVPASKPNVLVIYVDDVGYNDLGCYGARDPAIETPNIDRMAKEGIRFTNWISAANTCAPSRAALLTGRYPMRNGVAGGGNASGVFGEDHVRNFGLQPSEYTMAELLKDVGYKTAMYGKSHLGFTPSRFPTTFGFDEYYGSLGNFPVGGTCAIWDGDKMVEKAAKFQDVHQRLTDRTIKFMKASKQENRPFFIYLSHYLAHGPWDPNRQFATDEEWKVYKSLPQPGQLRGGGHKLYPALMRELDWHVGKVMDALQELSLDDNTIVFLVSDNGPWLPAGSAWPLAGSKFNSHEGGHRVPAIVRWPGKIPAGQVSDLLVSTMDVFPTLAQYAGAKVPDERVIDGRSIAPILAGEAGAKGHDLLYYYGGELLEAVREGPWKLHLPREKAHKVYWSQGKRLGGFLDLETPVLYNLDDDVGETKDVAAQHPEIVQRLLARAQEARVELGDWNVKGRDQKKQTFKGSAHNPKRYPRVPEFWFDFLRRQGIEIPE